MSWTITGWSDVGAIATGLAFLGLVGVEFNAQKRHRESIELAKDDWRKERIRELRIEQDAIWTEAFNILETIKTGIQSADTPHKIIYLRNRAFVFIVNARLFMKLEIDSVNPLWSSDVNYIEKQVPALQEIQNFLTKHAPKISDE